MITCGRLEVIVAWILAAYSQQQVRFDTHIHLVTALMCNPGPCTSNHTLLHATCHTFDSDMVSNGFGRITPMIQGLSGLDE